MDRRKRFETWNQGLINVWNNVLSVKTDKTTYTYRMGDEEYMVIYSIRIDDIEWFRENAEVLATNVCRLEIGTIYKPHQLSIDAFKERQKLEIPIRFEPAEVMRIAISDQRLVGGLPVIHLFGVSANGKMID